jgi:hypothetical protein
MYKRLFTTSEVGKILGKNTRFVIDWTERGLFVADVQPASGPGIKRLFSYYGVLAAAIALAIKEKLELPRSIIQGFTDYISQDYLTIIEDPKQLAEAHKWKRGFLNNLKYAMTFAIYRIGSGFRFLYSSQKIEDLMREEKLTEGTELVIYVDLSIIRGKVDEKIAQLF